MGFRGNFQNKISFDTSVFTLSYKDRIGFVQKVFNGNVKSERGNVGNAIIYGVETLIDFNLKKLFFDKYRLDFNFFINYSFINSEYLELSLIHISEPTRPY